MSVEQKEQGAEAQNAEAMAEAEFAAAFADTSGEEVPDAGEEEAGTGEEGEEREADGEPGDDAPEGGEAAGGTDEGHDPRQLAEDDPEQLRRKAQLLAATEGRLRKTQEELEAARRKLAEVQSPRVQESEALKPEDLPEDIRADVQAFISSNPNFAAVMLEKSRKGERLRRALEEYGPEHVLVEEMAERAMDERQARVEEIRSRDEKVSTIRAAHFALIFEAHPDFAKVCEARAVNPGAFDDYRANLDAWSEEKPGKEYKRIQQALNEGTSAEVIEVLNLYKSEKADRAKARRDDTRRRADDATVPPSRPSPPPKLQDAKRYGSFKSGWDEAE